MSRVLQALKQLETSEHVDSPAAATVERPRREPRRGVALPDRVATVLENSRGQTQLEELSDRMLQEFPTQWGGSLYLASAEPNQTFADSVAAIAAKLCERAAEPVLLIDGDLQDKWLSKCFAVEDQAGMTEILNLNQPPLDSVEPVDFRQLSVMPAGRGVLSDVHRPAIATFIETVRKQYRFVVVSGPRADEELAAALARQSDGTYLVVELDTTDANASREAVERFQSVGARLLGAIAIRPW